MFFSLKFTVFLIILAQLKAQKPDQVIQIFRHGARGSNSNYDPQWTRSESGKLTKVGMVDHYNLGKVLAQKYAHLIASGYNPNDIYVLSNYVVRCIESTMVQVSSLFRGKTSAITESLPKGLQARLAAEYESLLPESEANRGDYVPVKVEIASTEREKLLFNSKEPRFCKKMPDYVNENKNSLKREQAWRIFQESASQANVLLPENLGINDYDTLVRAFDAFIADTFDKRPLPGGINDTKLIESLHYGFAYDLFFLEQSQLIQRQLTSFHLLEAVLEQMANFRAGINSKKLAFYGGHDKNILAILTTFGIISGECLLANFESHIKDEKIPYPNCQYPAFSSQVTFEFYNDSKKPHVKFYYNQNLIPLCSGKESCDYEDFRDFVRMSTGNMTFDDWHERCENERRNFVDKLEIVFIGSSTETIFWTVFGLVVAIMFAATMIFKCKLFSRKKTGSEVDAAKVKVGKRIRRVS